MVSKRWLRTLVRAAVCALAFPAAVRAQAIPATRTPAQDSLAAKGISASNEQIAEAMRRSGMSELQIRERLRGAGYDPSLADAYFSSTRGGGETGGTATPEFTRALQNLGILSLQDVQAPLADAARTRRGTLGARESAEATAVPTTAPEWTKVFGKDIFVRSSNAFDPVGTGPVDLSYRLGVGDLLQLVVTGQVEFAYQLDVRRDGTVIIPQVGQVSVAGLTLEAARVALNKRLALSYSGISTGEAHADLTVSRLRSISVQVIGEVEVPGTYQLSALATVYHALATAGGPSSKGTFRAIQLRRAGKVIQTLDLYDYLLKGVATGDVRLEQGDVIFVPLNTRAVAARGTVRRVRQYELRPGEGFADLVAYAGGPLAIAATDRIQIDRVLPPAERKPGVERVTIDVALAPDGTSKSKFELLDGDQVIFFPVGDIRRNVVTIGGQVYRPGIYEFQSSMTLGQLVDRAQGFLPWALADQVKVVRRRTAAGTSELRPVDASTPQGKSFLLAEFDTVEVLDGRAAVNSGQITISGAINGGTTPIVDGKPKKVAVAESFGPPLFGTSTYGVKVGLDAEKDMPVKAALGAADSLNDRTTRANSSPGGATTQTLPDGTIEGAPRVVRTFVEHESLKDAIERAGGLRLDADRIELYRRRNARTYSDTTSVKYDFTVGENLAMDPRAATFYLEPDDRIVVRSAPGFRAQRFVTVAGEFAFQGDFAITEGRDRVRDIVLRAGNTRPGAYPNSFQLIRDGNPVGIDFTRAMAGDPTANVPVLTGDRLVIGRDPQTVLVTGAVARTTLVQYREGLTILDYIELAGGPKEIADLARATVQLPSGITQRNKKVAFFFHNKPTVLSGSVINVPEKTDDRGRAAEQLSQILSAMSTIASLLVAYAAFKR